MKASAMVMFGLALLCCPGAVEAGATESHNTVTVVLPRHVDTFLWKFEGGADAIVNIKGDGSTDLDFYVFDSNDNLVTKDDDTTDYCVLTWTPKWTGYFKIQIKNLGNEENRYSIRTN